jgi:hypothetical protein
MENMKLDKFIYFGSQEYINNHESILFFPLKTLILKLLSSEL